MAYFPNGSSGMDYLESYCTSCVNWRDDKGIGSEGCFIMDLHTLWNYDAVNGNLPGATTEQRIKHDALEHFIPTAKNGLYAERCKMFVPKNDTSVVVDKTDALREWEAIYGKRIE